MGETADDVERESTAREAAAGGIPHPMRTLRAKLVVFAAAIVIIPGACVGIIAGRASRASLEQAIGAQLAREASHAADRIRATLVAERWALESFSRQDLMREIRVDDIDKRISTALATFRQGSSVRRDYLVVTPDRRAVAAGRPASIGAIPEGITFFLESHDRPVVGPLELESGHPVVLMSAVIADPDRQDEELGILVGIYDWPALVAPIRALRRELGRLGMETSVLVVREGAQVVASAGESAARGLPPLAARAPRGSASASAYFRDREWLVGAASLEPPLAATELLVLEPLAVAFAPARRLGSRLALALSVALTLSLALAVVGAGRVSGPLRELTRATRGLARGERHALSRAVRTQDEVGTLAIAFQSMANDLDTAQRDLVEAAKYAFVGELAAGVAHEVRTSLGVLRSSVQILQRSLPEGADEESRELLRIVRAEVDRLGRIVDELLSLARPREMVAEQTVLSELLSRAAEFVEPQARERGVKLVRRACTSEGIVHCDSELIYEVALNLLVNAVQVAEAGGRVEVGITAPGAGFAGFEVIDDGPGIPDQLQGQVFAPFVTGRSGGIGLGLTFAKRVVHEHRGRITFRTEEGVGTTFRVELPTGLT